MDLLGLLDIRLGTKLLLWSLALGSRLVPGEPSQQRRGSAGAMQTSQPLSRGTGPGCAVLAGTAGEYGSA